MKNILFLMKPYVVTSALALAAVVYIVFEKQYYVLAIFFGPIFVLWFIVNLIRLSEQKTDRKKTMAHMTIWTTAFFITIIFMYKFESDLRKKADLVAHAVSEYMKEHDKCPRKIESLNLSIPEGKAAYFIDASSMKNHLYYGCMDEQRPFLYRRAVPILFDRYFYNFENKEWVFLPD